MKQNLDIKLFSLKKKNSHLKGKHLTSTKERERENLDLKMYALKFLKLLLIYLLLNEN